MKALLWALYLPAYAQLQVEVSIGYRHKPDLVALGSEGPLFWAEAGKVGKQKLERMVKRFPRTHFAFAVWRSSPVSMIARIRRQSRGVRRQGPVGVIAFPEDAATRFIRPQGTIRVLHSDLTWQRLA